MQTQGLSLDQAPPFAAPYRFFITAPLFAVAAGGMLLFGDAEGFVSRSSMPFLAAAHTLFIGFIAMVMMGAMQQMLPVIAGAKFPKPLFNARLIHLLLTVGTIMLASGFLSSEPLVLKTALGLLFFSFILFIVLAVVALMGVPHRSDSVRAFGYAFVSLAVALGFAIASGLAYAGVIPYSESFAHLHMAWIFFGWIMLLVIGVSFQVVPMFYVAEAYNPFCRTKSAPLIFSGLVVYSIVKLLAPGYLLLWAFPILLLSLLVIGYGAVSIRRLYWRKRAIKDANILFWYLAMGLLIAGVVLLDYGLFTESDRGVTLAGVWIAVGFTVSLISAMLYKIVPFLIWFHLTTMGHFGVPTMRELIDEKRIRLHLGLHLAALLLLTAAVIISPLFYRGSGLALILANGLFFYNLARAGIYYRRKKTEPVMDMGEWLKKGQ